METGKSQIPELELMCLVETVRSLSDGPSGYGGWQSVDSIGDNGMCSLEEATDYVRMINSSKGILRHHGMFDKINGQAYYTFEEIPESRDDKSIYLHIRVTPKVKFKK